MKYEVYNYYTDSVVCISESLEAAKEVALSIIAMRKEPDECVQWCEIREVPE